MTDYAAARTELASALTGYQDATGEGDPPMALVFGNGLTTHSLSKAVAEFRILVVAPGKWSDGATSKALGVLTVGVVDVIRGLAQWQFVSVGPDAIRNIGGGDYLTADVIARRPIDL